MDNKIAQEGNIMIATPHWAPEAARAMAGAAGFTDASSMPQTRTTDAPEI